MLKGERKLKRKALSGILMTLMVIGMLTLTFNVQTIGASPPEITVLKPLNITYVSSFVWLEFTINETASWIGYSLDNQANVTITISGSTLSGLSQGAHSVVVYANDTEGTMGASNIVYFSCGVTGDINGDGKLSGADVGKVYLVYAGFITNPVLVARSDVNGNGVAGPLDLADVAKMYLAYSGIYTF